MKPPDSLGLVQRIGSTFWRVEHGSVSADIATGVQTRVRGVVLPDLRQQRWPIRDQAKERLR